MKVLRIVWAALACLSLLLQPNVRAENPYLPVIASLSQQGNLVCTNLVPHGIAVVEWASSPSGPWSSSWASLAAVMAESNGSIEVKVPMFYRVRGIMPATNGMALVPAGSFTMGNSIGDSDLSNAPLASVYISGFYMDVNYISGEFWDSIYSVATNGMGYRFALPGVHSGDKSPIRSIFLDMCKWCNARSQIAGLTPVYYTDPGLTQVYTNSGPTELNQRPYVKWEANGYRLPTEAEWEKAARGGLEGQRFPWGNTISRAQANYNSVPFTFNYDLGPEGAAGGFTPPDTYVLNGYGLTDMGGNVAQRCWDYYWRDPLRASGSPYLGGSDPHGPATSDPDLASNAMVLRGSYYSDGADRVRCAYRSLIGIGSTSGFRCVRNQ